MKLFKILFFISIISLNVYPQTKNKLPKFDVNIGIGKVGGLRMGGRILFSKHFSFETSIGRPVSRILIPSDNGINLSLGINYHLLDKKNFTFSFIGAFQNTVTDKLKLTYLSPTVGVMILNKQGGHFFIRIGPYVESFSKGSFSKGTFGLNIELGYNFVF